MISRHEEAKALISPLQERYRFFVAIAEMHTAHISGFIEIGENLSQTIQDVSWNHDINVDKLFEFLAKQIDLPMEM